MDPTHWTPKMGTPKIAPPPPTPSPFSHRRHFAPSPPITERCRRHVTPAYARLSANHGATLSSRDPHHSHLYGSGLPFFSAFPPTPKPVPPPQPTGASPHFRSSPPPRAWRLHSRPCSAFTVSSMAGRTARIERPRGAEAAPTRRRAEGNRKRRGKKRKWREIESGGPRAGRAAQHQRVEWGRASRETGSSVAQRKLAKEDGAETEKWKTGIGGEGGSGRG